MLTTTLETDEEVLVERARSGDDTAFAELYAYYYRHVVRYFRLKISNIATAEDLTSETFARAFANIGQLHHNNFEAWLYRIASNFAYNHIKKPVTRREVPDGFLEGRSGCLVSENPETLFLEDVTSTQLLHAVRQLPTSQRTCIVLRFYRGVTLDEVAATIGRDKAYVAVLQFRALKTIGHIIRTGRAPKIGRPSKKEKRDA